MEQKLIMTKLSILVSKIALFLILINEIQAQNKLYQSFNYRNIGPARGGRVTAVAGVETKIGSFYMGATGGGVYKTNDYGITWNNVSDGFFNSPSIGAISVFQKNPKIVYVGTGSDGIRSNIINGDGVYKSLDSGKTWENIGLNNAGLIGAVEIHPNDSKTVFVAAIGHPFKPNKERGIFKSIDGGKSWKNVLFIADTVGVVDIEFAPDNPNILYAGAWRTERKPWTIISGGNNGGVYRSTNGGDSWTKVEKGLPNGLIGKIDLAVSKADAKRVYALVEAPEGDGGLYRSDNYGESFVMVKTKEKDKLKHLLNRPFYYINIEANPKNADILFSSANRFMRSDDGGINWKIKSTPHGDNHDIWIHPSDTSLWVQSNDGGANVTTNSGKTWSTQHNQSTAELYQVEVDDQYPYWLYAGQQDNSTIALPSTPPRFSAGGGIGFWTAVGGCETGPAVPKPGNPNIVYSNCKGRFGVYNKLTGQEKQFYVGAANIYGHNPKDMKFRFQRVSPIHVSPHNPDKVYHASQFVHETTNDGKSWKIISPDLTAFEPDKQVKSGGPITRDITGEENYSAIYSLRESKLKKGLIWVGSNDGPIHVTKNGGKKWINVTPKDIDSGGRVDCVEPSVHKKSKAYVAIIRNQLGDSKPYIYRTTNYGKDWKLLTNGNNGIPSGYPTRVVREDPEKEGVLYAGTEFGVFVSFDDGENWEPFQQNLPVTPVTDLKVYRGDLIISTMGRGFWILDNVSSLNETNNIANDNHLFKPRDAFRYRYRASKGNSVPKYPGPSVIVDYYIKDSLDQEISLNIKNQKDEIIYFVSSAKKDTASDQLDMSTGFVVQISGDSLTKNIGSNRYRWNMRHTGAWDKDSKKAYLNGPIVKPDKYIAELIIGNDVKRKNFTIKIDPKVAGFGVTKAHLNAQEELSLKVRSLLDKSKKLAYQLEKDDDEKNNEAIELLVSKKTPYSQPMLIDQIRYLASMLNRVDQEPGDDAYERFKELNEQLESLQNYNLDD